MEHKSVSPVSLDRWVKGPNGAPLSVNDLPPPSTRRWVPYRKAQVVVAVRGGIISLSQACARYQLTVEEFLSWEEAVHAYGVAGLRTTRLQHYRQHEIQ